MPSIKELFGGNATEQNAYPPLPTDEQVQQSVNQQYMDPLAAAQLTRATDQNQFSDSTGVANITLDTNKDIEEFKTRLRGYYMKPRVNLETGEELEPERVKFGDPVMNEEGINHLVGLLKFVLNKNTTLSNTLVSKEKEVEKICGSFMRTIALQIGINSEDWKVDRKRRDSLPEELALTLKWNIMRSYDDGERRKLYPGQRNITTTMINPSTMQPEKRSMISF